MNSDVVKFHASALLKHANALLPETEKIYIRLSNGWIEHFKKRFRLKLRRVDGEDMGADQGAIATEMSHIELFIMKYALRDV